MTIAVIIFAIVLLHLVVGLAWVLYKMFSKPDKKADDQKADSTNVMDD